jgi:hypothetical protein
MDIGHIDKHDLYLSTSAGHGAAQQSASGEKSGLENRAGNFAEGKC